MLFLFSILGLMLVIYYLLSFGTRWSQASFKTKQASTISKQCKAVGRPRRQATNCLARPRARAWHFTNNIYIIIIYMYIHLFIYLYVNVLLITMTHCIDLMILSCRFPCPCSNSFRSVWPVMSGQCLLQIAYSECVV